MTHTFAEIMRDTQNFLYAKSIKEWFCFPLNFAKFLITPFLQSIFGWLLLSRLKCKLKLWLQSKQIYTPLPWPLQRLSYKPLYLKQHHCNNSWEFKILQQMSSDYLLSTSACQNWVLICKTGNKWHMCKSIYMEVSCGWNELFWEAWLVPFFPRKRKCVVFENKKEAYKWVFPKLFALYLLWSRVQIVSFSDQSFLWVSGKDSSVKLEIWLVMTNDWT